jgi:hypothetical protein
MRQDPGNSTDYRLFLIEVPMISIHHMSSHQSDILLDVFLLHMNLTNINPFSILAHIVKSAKCEQFSTSESNLDK